MNDPILITVAIANIRPPKRSNTFGLISIISPKALITQTISYAVSNKRIIFSALVLLLTYQAISLRF
jgi:hypothetical protein